MAIKLIPYGLLPSGNYGINLNNTSGDPEAVALEILGTLPSVADASNFQGRLVFAIDNATIYVYTVAPTTQWVALEGVPASIGLSDGAPVDPKPLVTGSEIPGELFWTTDTEVLFVWDGLQWQAAGGRFATQVTEVRHEGDGIVVIFPAAITSAVPSEYIEVFIDGVRQNSLTVEPGTGDYSVAGTNIVFVDPPVLDAEIFIRSMQTVQVVQNTSITERVTISPAGEDTYSTGVANTDPGGVIVSIDGVVMVHDEPTLVHDYAVVQADTSVVSITKTTPTNTTALVATVADHGIPNVGTVVSLDNIETATEYNGSFTVSGLPTPTSFEITVPAATSDSVIFNTPAGFNLTMFFDPPFFEDQVVLTSPLGAGQTVYIKSFKNLIVAPSQGEANTLTISPTAPIGSANVSAAKIGEALHVKGLVGGANIDITEDSDSVTITASTGANFENRIGSNMDVIDVTAAVSYVGVQATGLTTNSNIQVNLDACGPIIGGLPSPPTEGRKITIKDEGGFAGTTIPPNTMPRNIHIDGPFGATFDGDLGPYEIKTDRGSVTLVYDASNNWNITAEKN